MRKVITTFFDYYEFEDIVNKYYGITNYGFVETEECGNDSSHTFEIKSKNPLVPYDQGKIDELKSTGFAAYSNYVIMQDLVNNDVLEPGTYVVEVSW